MKALAISMVAGAALCSAISVPASAVPMTNLAAAASDLALNQSVRDVTTAAARPSGVARDKQNSEPEGCRRASAAGGRAGMRKMSASAFAPSRRLSVRAEY
ncbi:MAG TPA: hypothetical protein VE251_03125 [Xanthobacteraceae bacterium]|nr:hypothetical protein [Xanthobacteraceae bacterium]